MSVYVSLQFLQKVGTLGLQMLADFKKENDKPFLTYQLWSYENFYNS